MEYLPLAATARYLKHPIDWLFKGINDPDGTRTHDLRRDRAAL